MAGDDYRQARADEKAARARSRSLRPWYKKKRYLLGIPLAAIIVLAIAGAALGGGNDDDSTRSSAANTGQASGQQVSPETQSPDAQPKIGSTVKVGDIDLTVLSADTVDTTQFNQFNDANYAVRIRVTNARGDKDKQYTLNQFTFSLVDQSGVGIDPGLGCSGCPDALPGGSVDIVGGGTFEGVVYFKLADGKSATELRFQGLFSGNKTAISLQ